MKDLRTSLVEAIKERLFIGVGYDTAAEIAADVVLERLEQVMFVAQGGVAPPTFHCYRWREPNRAEEVG